MSFRLKLAITSALIAFVPIVAISTAVFVGGQQALEQEILGKLDVLASAQRARVANTLQQFEQQAQNGGDAQAVEASRDFALGVIMTDYAGLGQTGETLLAERNEAGDAEFILPRRFEYSETETAVDQKRLDIPITQALLKNENIFVDSVDYRGVPVLAATRYIEAEDWGLVVKIDQQEAFGPVRDLRNLSVSVGVVAMLLIAVAAYVFASRFSNPIVTMTQLAKKIAAGNLSERISVGSRDEIGQLAAAFNDMTTRLQLVYRSLEDKVRERTEDLQNEKTRLAEAKARDDAILRNIGDGLVFTDTSRNVIMLNAAAEEMLGWKQSDVLGKMWSEVVQVKNENGVPISVSKLPIVRVMEGAQEVTTSTTTKDEFYFTRKDGSTFPVAITASRVVVHDEVVGAIVVFRDILLDKQVDRAKSEFVSLASHQLRTPLSTIGWYAEMLMSGDAGDLADKQQEYLKEIFTGNKRMVELVNALLDVSRIELGTFSIDPEEVDMVALLKNILHELEPVITGKQLTVTEQYAEGVPRMNVDPRLIRMVFQNLLSNAVKYTPGQGTVKVGVVVKGDELQVSVSDTGLGIPEDQQGHIFTKLFRADNARESDATGTGLGLYIAKAVVDSSGGKIWFESEENAGTTFYVSLPLAGMKSKQGKKKLGVH